MKRQTFYLFFSMTLLNVSIVKAEELNNVFNNTNQNQQPILQTIPQVSPNSQPNVDPANNENNNIPNTLGTPQPIVQNNNVPPPTGINTPVPELSSNVQNAVNLDNSQKTINDIKRETALLEAQKKLMNEKYGNQPTGNNVPQLSSTSSSTQTPIKPEEIITASMKNYIAFKNGTKLATILFGNGATTEVEIGSILLNYKVDNISSEGVLLKPLKGGKKISLPRNYPVNQTTTQTYNYQVAAPTLNSVSGQN